MSLTSLDDALAATLAGVEPIRRVETVPLLEAHGRVLAEPILATRGQPPFPASAMDGYAVRSADAKPGKRLEVIGTSVAGQGFGGKIGQGQAVRIFTGAPVCKGADAILIQENARPGDTSTSIGILHAVEPGRYIRPSGFDFAEGQTLLTEGHVLDPGALCLLASANRGHVEVFASPRVGIIATGNELVEVGSDPGPDQIISSSVHGVRPILEEAGAETFDAGIALDALDSLGSALDRCAAKGADLVVTLGGASVGDHDLVRPAFARRGVSLSFERVAMRPGKPLMHGRDAERFYLGLPGNPVSSLVCARLFGQPLVARLGGRPHRHRWIAARLGADLGENDEREEFMRATLSGSDPVVATPFSSQDSSLVSRYAHADGLVHRAAHAPPAPEGDECRVLVIREWG